MRIRLQHLSIILLVIAIACKKETKKSTIAPPAATSKKIYIPAEWATMDLQNNNSEWSYKRMASSANIVLFWQKEFGADPSKTADAAMRFDTAAVLRKAERIYTFYRDSLKFTGSTSRTDSLKMMILVNYSKNWLAAGAGYDNIIGAFWVTPFPLSLDDVVAHEMGHCFQYQVACDGRYGFRDQNYVGSFWEQCAQYMARQIDPASCLNDIKFFTDNSFRNFSNQEIRYQSFHLQEYWKSKHGIDFIGRLWRASIAPEHPLQTYKRMNGIDQAALNDEIADYAMRSITWDFPNGNYVQAAAGKSKAVFSTRLHANNNGSYTVDPAVAPECYGFNAFELNLPSSGNTVSVTFSGIDHTIFKAIQGWRYGFVSIDDKGKSTYSNIGKKDAGELIFYVPANSAKLWFVVSGAPTSHFNHVWDMPQNEIPQFSYQVRFDNTIPKP